MQASITFSHPLINLVGGDTGNWFIRFTGLERTITGVLVAPGGVIVTTAGVVANPGPDVVSYSPPPFDVVSDTTKPTAAPAFTDFPLV